MLYRLFQYVSLLLLYVCFVFDRASFKKKTRHPQTGDRTLIQTILGKNFQNFDILRKLRRSLSLHCLGYGLGGKGNPRTALLRDVRTVRSAIEQDQRMSAACTLFVVLYRTALRTSTI